MEQTLIFPDYLTVVVTTESGSFEIARVSELSFFLGDVESRLGVLTTLTRERNLKHFFSPPMSRSKQ